MKVVSTLSVAVFFAGMAVSAELPNNKEGAEMSPDPNRPIMMIRFSLGHEKPEMWAKMLPVIKTNKACFDEIWFSTGTAYPTLEKHQQYSRDMAAAAGDLREIGVIPSLQIQATIGHGDSSFTPANSGGKTWSSYVGRNGEQCKGVSCPRQPGFLKYWQEVCKIYAQWKPGSVWIDDDLRLWNHAPASDPCGCYCKDCLALFAKEEGKSYTREELVAACEKDHALDQRWCAFGVRSLCGVAQVIAETFHQYSPETRVALQHDDRVWRNDVFRTLQKYSGHRTGSRAGGGTYTDCNPYGILYKGIQCSIQKSQQPGYDVIGQMCPEIESSPRTLTCKTSQGHRLESLFYLSLGMDSLSYYILSLNYETPEWYSENLLAPLAAEAPAYREYLRFNEGTDPGGAGVFGFRQGAEELGFPLLGTAFAGASPRSSCYIVTSICVKNSTLEDLKKYLSGNLIVSGEAALELEKLGLGGYLGNVRVEKKTSSVPDIYMDHPLCQGFAGERAGSFEAEPYIFRYPDSPAFQAVTRYRRDGRDYGAQTVLYTRPDGSRVALMGRGFAMHYLSSNQVTLMNRIADWVSHETLPVLPGKPMQSVLVPRIAKDGTLRSVTVLNPTIGPQKEIPLILRNVPETVKTAKWIVPASDPVEVPVIRENGKTKVILPGLAAWDIGFAEF